MSCGRCGCRSCRRSSAARSAMPATTWFATRKICRMPRPTIGICPTWRSRFTTGWSCSTTSTRRWSSWRWHELDGARSALRPTHAACRRVDEMVAELSRRPRRICRPPISTRPAIRRFRYTANFTQPAFERGGRKVRRIHSGRRHFSGRAQPAAASWTSRPTRSRSIARCGW